ncbi:alpha-mannosidase [Cohnella fermenti]|uniref:Alpha-mannosidase n=1 Tax=Cohnella fermenti TaxID=2565925 RepID=A0A4S4C601_9BACL|nr:alpha-mannosidase [Cohnella fermenti]THF83281.1 alpha-mannosidase [Cohnella fermenti]
MFWTEQKLEARMKELEAYRYRDALVIKQFRAREDEAGEIGTRPPEDDAAWGTLALRDRWEGRDRYLWLETEAELPAEWADRRIVGVFDFGKTGPGNNDSFESLIYVNGVPYQGVDSNHKEVFLPAEAAGSSVKLQFRLWSGLEGGGVPKIQEHRLERAEIAWLDEAADRLFYLSKAILQTAAVLAATAPERGDLLQALDRAYLLIDWSRPGSAAFYESVAAAEESLNDAVAAMPKTSSITVRCIGHTHIDVAWLWRLKHTREKAARSFSTVLRLMELYPEYVFLQTQPQLYDYLKTDYPDLYAQLKERVREGRWEAAGGMWLEADCNLTSGESLVRQLLYGTRFLKEEFGQECTYLWLPDVFGYSWALPQILLKSGIGTFMTTKISWNQYNRMPHDTFVWRGIDGSEVLTHFVTTPEDSSNWWYTYNGQIDAASVKGIWDTYRDKGWNKELLLSYGYGDGGGGVNREHLEMRRALDRLPGLPSVVTGRADEYFGKLQETAADTDSYVHTWDGELYLEYHRGTYTSQAHNKRMNRKLELLSRDAEWLAAFRSALSGDWASYPKAALDHSWKTILRNQFHDIIPGSSIPEVYEDSRAEYEEARTELEQVRADAVQALVAEAADGADAYTVWNPSSWPFSGLVDVPSASLPSDGVPEGAEEAWTDADGQELAFERDGDVRRVRVEGVPSLGFATIRRSVKQASASDSAKSAESPFTVGNRSLATPYYEIEWNENGQLTRIFDREAGREVLAPGQRGNVLQVFEDKPKMFEAWDIDIFYQEKMREVDVLVETAAEAGALRAVVTFGWRYMDSTVRQRMIAYADHRRIDFETEVDWQERQQLLKVAFPVNVRATEATYDIQFGNVKRPTHWNTSWDYARFETVGHQWADLSEHGYGVSLLNDCKYGHDIKNNVIRLSLLKSATYPDPNADKGEHRFTYALYPHRGGWAEAGTVQAASLLNQPAYATEGAAGPAAFSLIRATCGDVVIDAVKKAEDENALIVRFHEYKGGRGEAALASDLPIRSWRETDLLERPIGEKVESSLPRLELAPYEIKTVRIEFE